jgi:hypothetical protein
MPTRSIRAQFDKNKDVYLSFDAAQTTQLSQQARDYVAKMGRITGQPWDPRSSGDFFIDALAQAKNPGDVANVLTRFSREREWMGDALAKMGGVNGRTSVAGTIEARDRNA